MISPTPLITDGDWQKQVEGSVMHWRGNLYAWTITKAGLKEGNLTQDVAQAVREITKCKAQIAHWIAAKAGDSGDDNLTLYDQLIIAQKELELQHVRQAVNDWNIKLYTRNKDMAKLFEAEREAAKHEAERCAKLIPWFEKEIERLKAEIEKAEAAEEEAEAPPEPVIGEAQGAFIPVNAPNGKSIAN